MTSKEKRKGTYHENWWVELFKLWGWEARKQPLSGILKDFPHDIEVRTKNVRLICESKYRAKGFALISKILRDPVVNLLLLKDKSGGAFVCFNVKNEGALKAIGIDTNKLKKLTTLHAPPK